MTLQPELRSAAMRQMDAEYRRDNRHVYRHIAGEHLLIALHRDAVAPMFALSASAAVLWDLLNEWRRGEYLVERLIERYEIDLESAERDVHEFLEQLLSIGAVASREVES